MRKCIGPARHCVTDVATGADEGDWESYYEGWLEGQPDTVHYIRIAKCVRGVAQGEEARPPEAVLRTAGENDEQGSTARVAGSDSTSVVCR